jgi:hypothetical protein
MALGVGRVSGASPTSISSCSDDHDGRAARHASRGASGFIETAALDAACRFVFVANLRGLSG